MMAWLLLLVLCLSFPGLAQRTSIEPAWETEAKTTCLSKIASDPWSFHQQHGLDGTVCMSGRARVEYMAAVYRERTAAAVDANAHDENGEDLISSEPWLWLPGTVVRKDRRRATALWVTLMVGFLSYIAYVIWETVKSRANPPSSVEMKQEPFKFPDMAFCVSLMSGCLESGGYCFNSYKEPWRTTGFYGFLDDNVNFTKDAASLAVEEAYPGCSVIPLSRLRVNKTGVDNGDVNYFSASFFFLWDEYPGGDFDISTSEYSINTQFVNAYFIDLGKGVEEIGENVVDAKLPYERIQFTQNEVFRATTNHMVLTMTEFTGISVDNGAKQRPTKTYSQSTTSGVMNGWWSSDSTEKAYAFMPVDIIIDKFEYTSIVEVDPVDGWAIIGSIGGVWQFVVLGFGLFFVYAEKQHPDMKMRNMKKTIYKPASVVRHRLSSSSSKSSNQDIEVDALDEDLPAEWVKKERKNGSLYYLNIMTGAMQDRSPSDGIGANAAAEASAVPSRTHRLARIFQMPPRRQPTQPLDESQGAYRRSVREVHEYKGHSYGAKRLPPGWIERKDDQGRTYYMNTILKTTQWQRPTQRISTNRCTDVQAIDTPSARSHESFAMSSIKSNESKLDDQATGLDGSVRLCSSATKVPSAAPRSSARTEIDETLPINWEKRVDQHGKIYFANNVTRKTQWTPPQT